MSAADLAFVNGSVYTVDAARTRRERRRRGGRADRGGRQRRRRARSDRRDHRGARSRTDGCCCPASRTRTSTRSAAVSIGCSAISTTSIPPRTTWCAVRSYAEAHPEREWILGGGWSMDVFPGGTPTEGPPRCGRARPHRVPAEPRRPQHVGEQSRARDRRGHGGHARSGRRPDRARTGRRAERHPPRGRRRPRGPTWRPSRRPTEVYEGLLEGQRYLHSLGITAWQDAIVTTATWMDNYSAYLRAAGERRSHRPRRRRALVGSGSRRRADRRPGRAARAEAAPGGSPRRA